MTKIASRLLLSIAVVASSVLVATTTAQGQACSGADVEIIFAVGSGQYDLERDRFTSPEAQTFFRMLDERGLSADEVYVDYPAARVPAGIFNGNYWRSVRTGVSWLRTHLEQMARCGREAVLGGYSQGAEVVGTAAWELSAAAQDVVKFVALFGDPRFDNSASNTAARGTFGSPLAQPGGILGARHPYLPDFLRGKAVSYCDGEDLICTGTVASGTTLGRVFGNTAHKEYPDSEIPLAANDLVAGVGDGLDDDLTTVLIPLGKGPVSGLDLAFVIDTTGSMGEDIDTVKADAENVARRVLDLTEDSRVALVQYRDYEPEDIFSTNVQVPFTESADSFVTGINSLVADGGGDDPEAVFSGLMTSFDLDWRPGVLKVAVLIGDAPAKDPEPVTGYVLKNVLDRALELDPVNIYAIPINGGTAESSFRELAEGSGGLLFDDLDGDTLAADLTSALDEIERQPVAAAGGPYEGRPRRPIVFTGASSFDPDDVITTYRWDFDADGAFDLETADPIVEHTYPDDYDGLAELEVVARDGSTGNGTAPVHVSRDVPRPAPPPGPPRDIEARPALDGTIELTWQPPEGARGDRVVFYTVQDDAGSMVTMVDGDQTSAHVDAGPVDRPLPLAVSARTATAVGRPSDTDEAYPFATQPDRPVFLVVLAASVVLVLASVLAWRRRRRRYTA